MSDTYTFLPSDGKFKFTVKNEFLKNCNNPEEFDHYTLLTTHRMINYLHNPVGPALYRMSDGHSEYFLDGKRLEEKEAKDIEHNWKFGKKLHTILDEK